MIGVATIISAREWEPALARAITDTAAARLVVRAYRPEDLAPRMNTVDVVVAGAETAWLSPPRLQLWRECGATTIGVHPAGDTPARRLLDAGTVDAAVADTVPTDDLVELVKSSTRRQGEAWRTRRPVAIEVTGPCAAGDLVEVGLTLATLYRGSVALIEAHDGAAVLPRRMHIDPHPDAFDVASTARSVGRLPRLEQAHGVRLCPGAGKQLPVRLLRDVVAAFAVSTDTAIVAGGPPGATPPEIGGLRVLVVDAAPRRLLEAAVSVGPIDDDVVVVALAEATASDAAPLVYRWLGRPPDVVVRRPEHAPAAGSVDPGLAAGLESLVRRWVPVPR